MSKNIVVALDGFASCGKSTLAKDLAKKLGYTYIDSGAMYRAVMLYCLDNNININDDVELRDALSKIHISFKPNPETGSNEVHLNGKNVERAIREMRVSRRVSDLSKIKAVRDQMVAIQQKLGEEKGIVMDGRDIGSVVFPDAELKIFMTADFDIRVKRRYDELKRKGVTISKLEVEENLKERDHIDTHRRESPLVKVPDAVEINNTNLSLDDQLEKVRLLAIQRMA